MINRLLSTTALLCLLAGASHATDIGTKIAVDCPINNCDNSISLTFAGEFEIATGTSFDGIEFGGISGVDYDAATGHYLGISDDRSQKAPARFYELDVKIEVDGLKDVSVVRTVTLKEKDGKPFAEKSVDPEQIRIGGDGLYWSSEGDGKALISPFVRVTTPAGDFVREFVLPEGFAPTADNKTGIRNNNAFESIAPLPSGDVLVANESALYQDGPISTLTTASPARVIRYDGKGGTPKAQYVYMIDPIPHAPLGDGTWIDNGLSDILALDDHRILVAERSFADNYGFTIRIFLADLDGATDVSAIPSLASTDQKVVPLAKSLVLDLGAIGLRPDNIESMTFAKAEDGSDVLLLASDNNFSKDQRTQFIAFKIAKAPRATN